MKTLQMRVRGFGGTMGHFKGARISFGINLREQGISLLFKGTMEFINREQGGKSEIFNVSKEHAPTLKIGPRPRDLWSSGMILAYGRARPLTFDLANQDSAGVRE